MDTFDMAGTVSMNGLMNDFGMDPVNLKGTSIAPGVPGIGLSSDENLSWEMIGLGLEEPLPPQEAIDELYVCSMLYANRSHYSSGPLYISRRYTMQRRCSTDNGTSRQ